MGRLAVVLGSSALGPGGETIAAAARRARCRDRAAPRRRASTCCRTRSTTSPTCGRWSSRAATACWRSARSARSDAELPVGSLLCPDDFIALHLGLSAFGDERAHRAPRFDPVWREEVLAAWHASPAELRDGGVYWQAIGPRFETPAEIRLMAAHADVVGMTIASECVVAAELGLAYAAICVVDNLANGIGPSRWRSSSWKRRAPPTPCSCTTASPRCCPSSAPSGRERGDAHRHRRRPRRRDGRAALRRTGRSPRSGPRSRRSRATRRSTRLGAPLVAPLLNGHTHAAMTLFRGYGGDLPLMRWLREVIWPVEAKLERRGRLLGGAAGLPGDDPHRHDPLLGHVLAPRGDGAGGHATPACGRRSAARSSMPTAAPRR